MIRCLQTAPLCRPLVRLIARSSATSPQVVEQACGALQSILLDPDCHAVVSGAGALQVIKFGDLTLPLVLLNGLIRPFTTL